jgi:hypothetical protein
MGLEAKMDAVDTKMFCSCWEPNHSRTDPPSFASSIEVPAKKQVRRSEYGNEFTLTLGRRSAEVGPPGSPQDMSLLHLFVIAAVLVIDS